ncbi:alpha/beta family hydrolase [Homoserinibacter sp. GY 40078]|uniref:alpha/beta hydrolase family protein n=1 Tax=Homoserinibacter sp. GY 40078 TaxID=2603275 RepID=UPI0011C7C10B|nr:alpha/beta family hydrolase [Homoserinibacter sp. GY 40078]TXK16334.1 alpha/beta hydrolase [Homoserinibacter sp. GY 40078]
MTELLWTGPADASRILVLAHGAGAPMDSPWMDDMAARLGERGIRVARFEFAYMAARREGVRRPNPRAEAVLDEYRAVIEQVRAETGRVPAIGGKSFGGRVASMIADELHTTGDVTALVCLGYPFHPMGKPGQLRTAHLAQLRTPALICQGERDIMGSREEVAGYALSDAIDLNWLPDGDHDLKPRKASGHTLADNLDATAAAVAAHLPEPSTP